MSQESTGAIGRRYLQETRYTRTGMGERGPAPTPGDPV
jgi:hypothetical protein